MIPPRPGMHPLACSSGKDWHGWVVESNTYWKYLADGVSALVPCLGIEYIGGGDVITVIYEDKSYAWLGGCETSEIDGPYAYGQANWVGGYRYAPDHDGEVFTELFVILVPDPDDIQCVIDSLVSVARSLATMSFTESV